MIVQIGFSSSNKIGSRLIRWFTKCRWSHCFIIISNVYGHYIIGEAKPPAIRLTNLEEFLTHVKDHEIKSLEVNDADHCRSMQRLLSLTGKYYGYFQLIGYIWPWLMNKLGFKKINPFIDGVVCSEYVGYYLKEVGYFKDVDVNELTPNDIYKGISWKE